MDGESKTLSDDDVGVVSNETGIARCVAWGSAVDGSEKL